MTFLRQLLVQSILPGLQANLALSPVHSDPTTNDTIMLAEVDHQSPLLVHQWFRRLVAIIQLAAHSCHNVRLECVHVANKTPNRGKTVVLEKRIEFGADYQDTHTLKAIATVVVVVVVVVTKKPITVPQIARYLAVKEKSRKHCRHCAEPLIRSSVTGSVFRVQRPSFVKQAKSVEDGWPKACQIAYGCPSRVFQEDM